MSFLVKEKLALLKNFIYLTAIHAIIMENGAVLRILIRLINTVWATN
jgi:hypothetical protein